MFLSGRLPFLRTFKRVDSFPGGLYRHDFGKWLTVPKESHLFSLFEGFQKFRRECIFNGACQDSLASEPEPIGWFLSLSKLFGRHGVFPEVTILLR